MKVFWDDAVLGQTASGRKGVMERQEASYFSFGDCLTSSRSLSCSLSSSHFPPHRQNSQCFYWLSADHSFQQERNRVNGPRAGDLKANHRDSIERSPERSMNLDR